MTTNLGAPCADGPGPQNTITDVAGIKVGQAHQHAARTGVSVVVPDSPCVCAVDVRGGGPGTRETDALQPENLVDNIDALVLAGGSVYGLAAADGVAASLGAQGRGFCLIQQAGVPASPIVPAAILYDLANGGDKNWGDQPPYNALGRAALDNACQEVTLGRVGAGFGANAGAYPGGLGSASWLTQDGWQVGALAAVNSFGSAYRPGTRQFWAAPFEINNEFGGRGWPKQGTVPPATDLPADSKIGQQTARTNTTICAIAVNARLTKPQAKRLAIMAQDGLAHALRPAHGPTDGDVVFVLATGHKDLPSPTPLALTRLGTIAADCLARAIARGVFAAEQPGDKKP